MSTVSNVLRLPGLDGSNPLGFLAAVGLVRLLDCQMRLENVRPPRLGWIEDGYWLPLLHGCGSIDHVIATTARDQATWADDPAFLLAYNSAGDSLLDPRGTQAIRDLKPKPAVMRAFLEGIAGLADQPVTDGAIAARRSMDTAAAYGSELVQDNKGNTKPLALHFTAGQQTFLDAVAQLQAGVSEDDLREALIGPWRGTSTLPSMSWNATVARSYALRAADPSSEKRGSVPGADWLAFIGLGLLLVTPHRRTLLTTGVRGGWKDSAFVWPIWTPPGVCSGYPKPARDSFTCRSFRKAAFRPWNCDGLLIEDHAVRSRRVRRIRARAGSMSETDSSRHAASA